MKRRKTVRWSEIYDTIEAAVRSFLAGTSYQSQQEQEWLAKKLEGSQDPVRDAYALGMIAGVSLIALHPPGRDPGTHIVRP